MSGRRGLRRQVAQGRLGPEEALRRMQRDTVRYAKRQWTWFAGEPGIRWVDVEAAGGVDGAAEQVEKWIVEEGLAMEIAGKSAIVTGAGSGIGPRNSGSAEAGCGRQKSGV